MKGIDTNVLVRYITQDDPHQAMLAERAIETARSQNEKLLIQPIVICEIIWVLDSAYGFRKSDILPVIDQILRTAQFNVVDKDVCWKAFADFQQNSGDFADYVIGRANERDGADGTLTLDKALEKSDLFLMLPLA